MFESTGQVEKATTVGEAVEIAQGLPLRMPIPWLVPQDKGRLAPLWTRPLAWRSGRHCGQWWDPATTVVECGLPRGEEWLVWPAQRSYWMSH